MVWHSLGRIRGWVHFYGVYNALPPSRATAILPLSGIRLIVVRWVLSIPTLWSQWGSPYTHQHQLLSSFLKPSVRCIILLVFIFISILPCYFKGMWPLSADPEVPLSHMCLPILWFLITSSLEFDTTDSAKINTMGLEDLWIAVSKFCATPFTIVWWWSVVGGIQFCIRFRCFEFTLPMDIFVLGSTA